MVGFGDAYGEGVDDVAYTKVVISQVRETGCIDLRRVYATGFSNGAIMTHTLACEASDVIAAAAPVSGPRLVAPEQCDSARPMPLQLFQGTDDSLASYELREQSFEDWRDDYECAGELLVEMYESGTCETYDDCVEGGSVTFCSIPDHDHCWPGPLPCSFDGTPTDFPGNAVILDFFETAALPADQANGKIRTTLSAMKHTPTQVGASVRRHLPDPRARRGCRIVLARILPQRPDCAELSVVSAFSETRMGF